jgi:hypothetical protein
MTNIELNYLKGQRCTLPNGEDIDALQFVRSEALRALNPQRYGSPVLFSLLSVEDGAMSGLEIADRMGYHEDKYRDIEGLLDVLVQSGIVEETPLMNHPTDSDFANPTDLRSTFHLPEHITLSALAVHSSIAHVSYCENL